MTKKLFLLISLFVFSESALSMQVAMKAEEGLRSAARYSHYHHKKRFYSGSTTSHNHLIHTETSNIRSNSNNQVYSIPTYDATFKYMLSDPTICLSFLRAFTLKTDIETIERLDEHLIPVQRYQIAQSIINDPRSQGLMDRISKLRKSKGDEEVGLDLVYKGADKKLKSIANGAWFISEMSEVFGDILSSFPTPARNSAVDVLCRLNNGSHALVEVQVVEEDFWDQRALAYASSIYSRQIKRGSKWDELQEVICINILGGGLDSLQWDGATTFKHLKFKDQNNTPMNGGIEILQYPLYHHDTIIQASREAVNDTQRLALREWIDFLEHASRKKEADVAQVKTEGLREAYEKVKYQGLPAEVKEANEKQDEELFRRSAGVIAKKEQKARLEGLEKGEQIGLEKIARKMLNAGKPIEEVAEMTGLLEEQIKKLKGNVAETE